MTDVKNTEKVIELLYVKESILLMSDFDPFLVESSAIANDEALDMTSDETQPETSTSRRKYSTDFELPEEMESEKSMSTEPEPVKPMKRAKSARSEDNGLTIGHKKRRRSRAQTTNDISSQKKQRFSFIDEEFPSSSEASEDPNTLEKNVVEYLDAQMSTLCQDFLGEFKFEMEKAFSFQTQIEEFVQDVMEEVRNVVAEEEAKAADEREIDIHDMVEEDIRSQFAMHLSLPERKTESSDIQRTSHHVIDHARTDFSQLCTEYMNEYRNEVNQLNVLREKLAEVDTSKQKALMGTRMALEQYDTVIDELSSFIEERLMRIKKEQRMRREKQLAEMSLQHNDIFSAPVDATQDLDDLLTLISDYSPTVKLTTYRMIRSDAQRFREDIQSSTNQFCFCVDDFMRVSHNCGVKAPLEHLSENTPTHNTLRPHHCAM